jgi:hypothetical protein
MTKPQSQIYINRAALTVLKENARGRLQDTPEIRPGIFAIYVDDDVLAELEKRQKAAKGASISDVIVGAYRDGAPI